MKNIGIIGSTGSIGTQTLEVIRELSGQKPDSFCVSALACGNSVETMAAQAREFGVKLLCTATKEGAEKVRELLKDMKPTVLYGPEGLRELAAGDMDMLVTAIVGMAGIEPTLEAIKKGTDIALANKETLVAAGELVMSEAKARGVSILPVDSEHSAVFQCLRCVKRRQLSKIILTCSGGPFRTYPAEKLSEVTPEMALGHPTWNMGGKITIDSATLMNKGLEVIEAARLYATGFDDIEVTIHPQSIVHSMIKMRDGAVIAQLGCPSMKLPIQYALTYPDRYFCNVPDLDFQKGLSLTFEQPDRSKFPCLDLAISAGREGGSMPACMNAANEKAVRLFLDGKATFTDIPKIVEKAMNLHKKIKKPTAEEILAVSYETYETAGL
ncbi:MAG: 1-deoxy-D-xylulose-5-phosphate reductoisomerase [Clostridia bacterium]|nr:1-deoxy-D-xylulose-5-phosphate reductoisomerase [Clostridia bacterium]